MELIEKRMKLNSYCEITDCEECVLNCGGWDNMCESSRCLRIEYSSEEDLDKALEMIEFSENVNHPSHYQGKNECIDVMIAMFGVEAVKSFCKCNAYKYRFRAAMKNGDEDIKKAEWYESKLIDLEAGE